MATNNANNIKTIGLQSLTSAGVLNGRSITANAGFAVTNGDGTAGNPTIALASPTNFAQGMSSYRVLSAGYLNGQTAAVSAGHTLSNNQFRLCLFYTTTSGVNTRAFGFIMMNSNSGTSAIAVNVVSSGASIAVTTSGTPQITNSSGGTRDFEWDEQQTYNA